MNRREMLGSLMALAAAPLAGPLVMPSALPDVLTITDRDVVCWECQSSVTASRDEQLRLNCSDSDIIMYVTINGRRFMRRMRGAFSGDGLAAMMDERTGEWCVIKLWGDHA